jgi:hypothetical protein
MTDLIFAEPSDEDEIFGAAPSPEAISYPTQGADETDKAFADRVITWFTKQEELASNA